jgi:DNA-binding Lrp family transcriptional regulator
LEPAANLDGIDHRILALLSEEGRIAWRDLAARIGLSETPTVRRVRALEAAGLIRGYHARLDEGRLGRGISIFIQVSLAAQTKEALALFEDHIARAPEVMSCYMMTGEADYLLRVAVGDLEAYQDFLARTLTRIPGVARLNSSFALKAVVDRPSPPLGPHAGRGR